jgi:hypothetical protein
MGFEAFRLMSSPSSRSPPTKLHLNCDVGKGLGHVCQWDRVARMECFKVGLGSASRGAGGTRIRRGKHRVEIL